MLSRCLLCCFLILLLLSLYSIDGKKIEKVKSDAIVIKGNGNRQMVATIIVLCFLLAFEFFPHFIFLLILFLCVDFVFTRDRRKWEKYDDFRFVFFVFAYRLQNNNYVVIGKSMNCTHRPEWMATVTCFMRRVNRTAENWRFDAYINLIVREVYSSSENEFHWLLFTIFVAFVSSLFFQGEIYDVASNERTGVSSVCYN